MATRRHFEKSMFKLISVTMEFCTLSLLLEPLGLQNSILVLILYFIIYQNIEIQDGLGSRK